MLNLRTTLLGPVFYGSGVLYFDKMRDTVYRFVQYQKVIFDKH